jgi:hypothetical protein
MNEIIDILKKSAPFLVAFMGGPLELVLIAALCAAFGVTPDRLVDAMLDEEKRGTLEQKLKDIIIPH